MDKYEAKLDICPVFIRQGAIIPMYPDMNYVGEKPADVLTLDLYPYGNTSFNLYEDDGLMLLPFVILIAVFYFLLIRPENKKKKAAAKMRSELAVGDEITTIGGVVGTICQVKEDTIIIETSADRVRMEFTKWAISTKGTQSTENAPADTKDSKDKK